MKDNNKPMFENVLQYGDLYKEYTLGVDDSLDLLLVLRNDKNDVFILMLIRRDILQHYMILKMDIDQIISLMKNEITLLDMFKSADDIISIIIGVLRTTMKSIKFSEINPEILPNECKVLGFYNGQHDEYINILKKYKYPITTNNIICGLYVKKHGTTQHYDLYEVIAGILVDNPNKHPIIAVYNNYVIFSGTERPYQENCDVKLFIVDKFIGFIKEDLDVYDSIQRYELEIVE